MYLAVIILILAIVFTAGMTVGVKIARWKGGDEVDKQREKLIELIQNAVGGCARNWAEVIADHLLANGVIVPPCKVGDTVYRLYYDELCEATVVDIEINYYTNPQYWLTIEYYSKSIGKHSYKSRIDLILGKTVFLSKEDAEKTLKNGG